MTERGRVVLSLVLTVVGAGYLWLDGIYAAPLAVGCGVVAAVVAWPLVRR